MDATSPQELSGDEIQYAIQHVFLPPNLPQSGDDPQSVAHETMLLAIVEGALRDFSSCVDPGVKDAIDAAYHGIHLLRNLRDRCGFANEGKLRNAFCDLTQNGV